MDFTLNQAGHGDYLIKASDYFDYLAAHDDKPFVEGEALYEFCSTLEEMGTRCAPQTCCAAWRISACRPAAPAIPTEPGNLGQRVGKP